MSRARTPHRESAHQGSRVPAPVTPGGELRRWVGPASNRSRSALAGNGSARRSPVRDLSLSAGCGPACRRTRSRSRSHRADRRIAHPDLCRPCRCRLPLCSFWPTQRVSNRVRDRPRRRRRSLTRSSHMCACSHRSCAADWSNDTQRTCNSSSAADRPSPRSCRTLSKPAAPAGLSST